MSTALLGAPVVAVQPALVRAFGSVTTAAVVQQIHYHAVSGHAQEFDGAEWVGVTYADLGREIGLSGEQVRRAVGKAEALGVLVSCQPEGYQRRKWYRIDQDQLTEMVDTSDSSKRRDGRFQTAAAPLPNGARADTPSIEPRDKRPGEELSLLEGGAGREPQGLERTPGNRARKPNPMYDAFHETFPDANAGLIGRAMKDLREKQPDATPEQVRARAPIVQAKFDPCTPLALVNHWLWAGQQVRPAGSSKMYPGIDLNKVSEG